jgi:hypothetical protein
MSTENVTTALQAFATTGNGLTVTLPGLRLVAWHLTYRVPLNFAAIPEAEIAQACERFNLTLETWARQERAFGLLRKIYAKRAKIRGQQPLYL